MKKRILFVAGMAGLAVFQSLAGESSESLQKLVTAIQQEFDTGKPSGDENQATRPDMRHMILGQLRRAVSSGDPVQIESALAQMDAYISSGVIRRQCEELEAQFHSRSEAMGKKAVEEISSALKHAGEAVHEAKKPADLDAVLHELGQLSEHRNGQQPSIAASNAWNKVQPALRFVSLWQDYLSATGSGNTNAAGEALRRLADDYNGNLPDLIPRSEILAWMQKLKLRTGENDPSDAESTEKLTVPKPLHFDPATRILSFNIQKLDELDSAVNAFEDLKDKPEFRGYSRFINEVLNTLRPLQRAYSEIKSGLPVNIEIPSGNSEASSLQVEVTPLRAELILLALPRYLELPRNSKPKPGEGPYDFLNRITTEAVAHGDYLLASRAREAQRLLRERKNPDPNEKNQAQLFVTANNQEIAGQYALAVDSYQKALASGADIVPPKIIGDRLAKLKAEHPEEFAKGLDLYLSPPMYRQPGGYPPGWPPGMNAYQQMQPQRSPAAILSVPATSPQPNS